MNGLPGWLAEIPGEQPYPPVFATVSGAHLYGFPSADSDVDLRGARLLPVAEVAGLRHGPETLERTWTRDGVEVDLVTHDLAKFARLLLNRNGYVLEQLLSPLVVAPPGRGLRGRCGKRPHGASGSAERTSLTANVR
ncbi:hypothetical protein E1295_42195 [Nonomuraea mesophila]|uniref:Nucleotidyltransferase domain-containing protein n=1 Tax=Nonomuraea mesophila TaxID=2530382 RepID=A0A4R5EA02_9ACTN|nr:nucleotidyltransferase domain-containing protein [Nonomuraea mesophila]TDE28944.1 hypothetical protein E1295_42195 [Nonomuraea mesophila]